MTIYHLDACGVPVSWSLTAVYAGSYGVAIHAAASWHEKHDSPQFVIEIENGAVKRSQLFMKPQPIQHRESDKLFLQGFRRPHLALPDGDEEIIDKALHAALVEVGFLIPDDLWDRMYPAQKLISDRFREFNAAYDAKPEGEKLAFDERWIMMMEKPDDHVLPFTVKGKGNGYALVPQRDNVVDPSGGRIWPEIEDAKNYARHLNSGWSWEETLVLMTPEPRTIL